MLMSYSNVVPILNPSESELRSAHQLIQELSALRGKRKIGSDTILAVVEWESKLTEHAAEFLQPTDQL
ncbi:MAG: hypothetical protein DHS20C12_11790 [Pseudohongiella sp.]|nr:MAG: hypothetical protein DHS20C12_11790 [Pseudohongiella sp.]